jgi:hypothetical protein
MTEESESDTNAADGHETEERVRPWRDPGVQQHPDPEPHSDLYHELDAYWDGPDAAELDTLAVAVAESVAKSDYRNEGCDPLEVAPQVRWWVDWYRDDDYQHAVLARVFFDAVADDGMIRHLFVAWTLRDGLCAHWDGEPVAFFDQGADWSLDAAHRFVVWSHDMLHGRAEHPR